MRWINVDTVVHAQVYDEEHEEWFLKKMTVEDFLDAYANEGCPTIVSEERRTGQWINCRNDDGHNIADCNVCGNTIQWFDGDEKPRFCCMCGARMT